MKTSQKMTVVGVIGIILVLMAAVVLVCFVFTGRGAVYYTRIDNSCVKENQSRGGVIDFTGGMEYIYTLSCYNDKGKEDEVSFGTDRQLRQDAFLRLEVVPIRGVIDWEEVQYEDLPQAVRDKY